MSDTAKRYTYGREQDGVFRIRRRDGSSVCGSLRGIDGGDFIVAEFESLAGQLEQAREGLRGWLKVAGQYQAQRDAAVEALAKIARVVETVTDADFAGSSTLAWGRVRGIVEAAMAATPAPTVNAELLAACKALLPFAANGHATGESLAEIVRPNRAIAQAKAAIAKAENGGVA